MNAKIMKDLQSKYKNRSLIDYAENLANLYIHETSPKYRKKRGQYFTPKKISKFMVKQFEDINKKDEISILDPGAGVGVFESAFCEHIKSIGENLKLSFDLYECDAHLVPLLNLNMELCKENMINAGVEVSYNIFNEDFILSNSSFFNEKSDDFDLKKDGYDFVISNPPYYKIQKKSPQATAMKRIIKGQPNIYVLFMALSAKLLKDGGQITVLSPRSYCSGLYFREFRKWFFKNVKPIKIHIFESRKIFKKYNVQQEMVILTATKNSDTPRNIIISTSNKEPNEKEDLQVRKTGYRKIVIENDEDIIIRIPISELDEQIAEQIDKFGYKLIDLGLKASTGSIVPFRAKNYLLNDINKISDFIPLIWMQNIKNGEVKWPILLKKKPIGIKNKKELSRLLITKGNYVLIKRFSTKEGKRRINAGVLLETSLNSDYVGIENHVNYIHKIDKKLTEDEAYGLTALLNSRLYNRYFQISNGNTQVNASEINNIPFPPIEKIRSIGILVRKNKKKDEVEETILKKLNIDENILNKLINEEYRNTLKKKNLSK